MMDYIDIDINLVGFGRKKLDIAEIEMTRLTALRSEYGERKPLNGERIVGSIGNAPILSTR